MHRLFKFKRYGIYVPPLPRKCPLDFSLSIGPRQRCPRCGTLPTWSEELIDGFRFYGCRCLKDSCDCQDCVNKDSGLNYDWAHEISQVLKLRRNFRKDLWKIRRRS